MAPLVRVRGAAPLLLLTAIYFSAGNLGLTLAVINPSASPVWPPTGIALAAVLILGRRVWPAIALGAFAVNYVAASGVFPSLAIAVGNALEALVGAYLVSRFAGGRVAFDRSRDCFAFVVLAGFVSTTISATIGTTSLALSGAVAWPAYWSVWLTWWLGNAGGNVVVAPLILLWAGTPRPRWTSRQWCEIVLLTGALVAVATLVFVKSAYPLEFLTIPLCVWAGARFGPREAATATAILSIIGVWAAVVGAGPFGAEPANTALLLTQTFLVVAQIAGLATGAAVVEMTAAHDMLRTLNARLEERVAERTAKLRASEARLAEAQEVAHIGSWEWDARSGDVFWSDELYRICGMVPGASQPHQIGTAVHPDDRTGVAQIVERAIARGESFQFESRLLLGSGQTRIGFTRGRVIQDRKGQTLRLVGTVQDVTDQKQLEAGLRQAQKLEALGLLAGGIAHDFNNLITAIGGYTELVLTKFDRSARGHDDLLEVRKAADRAAALTRRLLTFSRTQSVQLKTVDINALVTSVESLLRRTIGEHIELILTLAGQLQAVRVDPNQVEQAVLNIALNARDAMPSGGQLRFVTAMADVEESGARQHPAMTPGRYVLLSITDTGVGMSPEIQARIFEPLFSTKPPGQGTGFGLATAYATIRQAGGFIVVSSEPGRGSVFDIYLPALAVGDDVTVDASTVIPGPGGGETILLVEDDGAVRRLSRDVLTQAGYTVIDARDGEEALTIARPYLTPVDLVLTDVVMPGLAGEELAARLRKGFPAIRVLYTSGYTPPTGQAGAREASAPFLPKPFLPSDLLSKVREVLSGEASIPAS
jgi:PAS domain S-box-containing protein